jgi:hypothetical protein
MSSITQRTFLTYLQEIHQKGLDEVARIEEEMKEILEEMGFSNLTLPQFIDMIRFVAFLVFDICYPQNAIGSISPTQCFWTSTTLMRIRIRLI